MAVEIKTEVVYLKPRPHPITGGKQNIADPSDDTRFRGIHRHYLLVNRDQYLAAGKDERGEDRVQPKHVPVVFENGIAKVEHNIAEMLIEEGTAQRERPIYVTDPEFQGRLAELSGSLN